MAKGNTGQGQYRPSAGRKALTNAPSSQIRTPSTGNDFLGSIQTAIGNLPKDKNTTDIGGGPGFGRNSGISGGMFGGQNWDPYGSLLMGTNPWNSSGGFFNPFSMFGGGYPSYKPTGPTAQTPSAPAAPAPRMFSANEASQQLRSSLNKDLTGDEIGQLLAAMGKKATDQFTQADIDRAKTLVGQQRPNYLTPSAPTAPTVPTTIDPGGASRPVPSAPAPPDLNALNQQLRSRLTRDLSGDEIGLLMGALGGNMNVDAATNLIRQHMPSILR